ncbi:MAG: hypothetical protein RLY20_2677 [Verrucomicrobiota bacterium]|jgi:predicted dehydrogenase
MNQNEENNGVNRRDFIRGGSIATLMTMLGGVPLVAAEAPAAAPVNGSKIKIALVGCGAWGRELLRTLAQLPVAEVVAVCDTYGASARKAAADVPGAKVVADYNELLSDKSVQAVILATPTHKHRDVAIAALKAGKHVYCEVPLAHSIEDAKAIALAAKAAPRQIFQSGLQLRSDAQTALLLPFFRTGKLGNWIMGRAQWNKKMSWRAASPKPEREKELNWRLDKTTSHGLLGEIGIHQLDRAALVFNARPTAVMGYGSLVQYKDGRDVPETVQAMFEFPNQIQYTYNATLASGFDADYEVYHGTFATVVCREDKAWMFKEVDSELFGFEVYCRRDRFFRETGIALIAGASKQDALSAKPDDPVLPTRTAPYQALNNFLKNVASMKNKVSSFTEALGKEEGAALDEEESQALQESIAKEVLPRLTPAASAEDGFSATVTAIKANEAILSRQRLEFKDAWYQLS